jgi:hypothetical protein
MDGYKIWKAALLSLVILALLATTACEPTVGGGATQAWIDVPLDRAQVDASKVGQVNVKSHAASRSGITRVDLFVNGQLYRSDDNPTPNEPLIYVTQPWIPPAPGTYVLDVQALSGDGQAGKDSATVEVIGTLPTEQPTEKPTEQPTEKPTEQPTEKPTEEGPTFTPTPCPDGYVLTQGKCVPLITPTYTSSPTYTPSPTGTPQPPTPTFTPSPTGTPKPPTPTFTPSPTPSPPPADIRFWADPENIGAGGCSTVYWHVSNISAYWVDGQPGAGDDGSFQRCGVCADEQHQLHVVKQDGSEEDHYATIHVSGQCITPTSPPPQDTTPPPAPSPIGPTGSVCLTSITLQWSAVSDPSGIAGYAVKMEKKVGTNWQSFGGYQSTTTSVVVPLKSSDCGYNYRWMVRAQDGAGNWSNWSSYGSFFIQSPLR